MKKGMAMALTALMLASVATGCGDNSNQNQGSVAEPPANNETTTAANGGNNETQAEGGDTSQKVTVGACIYKFDDTFMTGVRNVMESKKAELNVDLSIVDSQNKQPTQNEQVDTFITKGVNALAINPVDRTAAGPLVDKAKAENIPIVFMNREPEADVMKSYDKVWYVGAKAEESGTMSGEIIAEYFEANPSADKNGDHKVQYVMLTGEPGHQDAVLRTDYSTRALKDKGWEGEQLASDTAMWDKVQATDKMKNFITAHTLDKIEAVICNNDDMALGAIEALKAEGYNTGDESKFIPVVGVDATAPALEAMGNGSLLGTVLNDAQNQGTATINIAAAASRGQKVNKDTIGYEVTDADGNVVEDGKYVWVPYVKVTKDNYQNYKIN